MGDIVVRRAAPHDAEVLTDLHHACWVEAYTDLLGAERIAGVFADRPTLVVGRRAQLADPVRATLLAFRDGAPVGFAASGAGRRPDAPTPLELYALYTRAAEWGRGTGRALLAAAIGREPAHLWLLEGNDRARSFYAKHGFALDGAVDLEQPLEAHLRMVRR